MKFSEKQTPTLNDLTGIIPEDKRGIKTLKEITTEIQTLLKPYKSNANVGIEYANGKPMVINLTYEIFL